MKLSSCNLFCMLLSLLAAPGLQVTLKRPAGKDTLMDKLLQFASGLPTPTSQRLAVPVLAVQPIDPAELCCVLSNFQSNLLPETPADIYVFSKRPDVLAELKAVNCQLQYSTIMATTPGRAWRTPEHAKDPQLWTATRFKEAYRRMGHWRLTFQMDFATTLGYPYILQLDLDSFFPERVHLNLVEHMLSQQGTFGARRIGARDAADVFVGLAELARYFLVAEGVQPTILFEEDCLPHNISGLFSGNSSSWAESGGHSRRNLSGNFLLVSTAFWQRPQVKRFLHLVLATGGHFRFRWNEQAVMAMMWQIFAEKGSLVMFDKLVPYKHAQGACLVNTNQSRGTALPAKL